jgi:hypothetical protein
VVGTGEMTTGICARSLELLTVVSETNEAVALKRRQGSNDAADFWARAPSALKTKDYTLSYRHC